MPVIFRDVDHHATLNHSAFIDHFENITVMPATSFANKFEEISRMRSPLMSSVADHDEVAGDTKDVATFLIAGLASCFIVVGGAFPYIPQYVKIRRENSAEGFSLYVCLALLSANILRIFFWFGQPFETPLLLQSIVMITTMLIVLHAATNAEKRRIAAPRTFSIAHFRRDFWQWTDFESYIQFLVIAAAIFALPYYFLINNYWVVQSVGTVALVTEACQPIPQFWRNWKHRSTEGMSITMVALWALGDFFKTIYFVTRNTPLQFPVCGVFQLGVDLAILAQVFFCFPPASARGVVLGTSSAYTRSNSAAVRNVGAGSVGLTSQMSLPNPVLGGWPHAAVKPVVD